MVKCGGRQLGHISSRETWLVLQFNAVPFNFFGRRKMKVANQ